MVAVNPIFKQIDEDGWLTQTARSVMMKIHFYDRKFGYCNLSNKQLAKKANCKQSYLEKLLTRLERHGYISRIVKRGLDNKEVLWRQITINKSLPAPSQRPSRRTTQRINCPGGVGDKISGNLSPDINPKNISNEYTDARARARMANELINGLASKMNPGSIDKVLMNSEQAIPWDKEPFASSKNYFGENLCKRLGKWIFKRHSGKEVDSAWIIKQGYCFLERDKRDTEFVDLPRIPPTRMRAMMWEQKRKL